MKVRIMRTLVFLCAIFCCNTLFAAKPYDCQSLSIEVMSLRSEITNKPYQDRYNLPAKEINMLQENLGSCPEEVLKGISSTPLIAVVCGRPVTATYDLMMESIYHRQEGLGNILGDSRYKESKELLEIYYSAKICADILDYHQWKIENPIEEKKIDKVSID